MRGTLADVSFSFFPGNITTNLRMKGKKITKSDGKDYMDITEVDASLMPGKMELNLENLFNGDKQLGKMTSVANQYPVQCSHLNNEAAS